MELFIGILSAAEAWRFQMQNSRFFEIDHGGSSSDHGTYLAECPEPHAATVAMYYDLFVFFSYFLFSLTICVIVCPYYYFCSPQGQYISKKILNVLVNNAMDVLFYSR